MKFNWLQFLKQYNIEFVERGPNVARGNVNLKCPFCGIQDESEHLGVHLELGYWACWRNQLHRGKNPRRLIQKLLDCSYEQSVRIVENNSDVLLLPEENDFSYQIGILMYGNVFPENSTYYIKELHYPFREIVDYGSGKLFFNYLVNRGYPSKDVWKLIKDYQLGFSITGPFNFRVMIPVIMEQGLVTWTGRAITDNCIVRYKTLSTNKEKCDKENLPQALMSIKDTLWNYKNLLEHPTDTLYVVEGPFDAMRIDFYGKSHGIRSTCLFSKTVSDSQLELLDELAYIYQQKYLLLDRDSQLDTLWMMDELRHMKFEPAYLTKYKDPALLSPDEISSL